MNKEILLSTLYQDLMPHSWGIDDNLGNSIFIANSLTDEKGYDIGFFMKDGHRYYYYSINHNVKPFEHNFVIK